MIEKSIEIREAHIFDLPALLSLYRFLETDPSKVLTHEQASQVYKRIKSYPNYKIYLVLKDNQVVGTYALLIIDNISHRGAPSAVVENVVVHDHFRNQGIGKIMMKHAMQICREEKCYKLALSSNKVRIDAHRFYEDLGFKQHGVSFLVDLI